MIQINLQKSNQVVLNNYFGFSGGSLCRFLLIAVVFAIFALNAGAQAQTMDGSAFDQMDFATIKTLAEWFPKGASNAKGPFSLHHGHKTGKVVVFVHGLLMNSSYFEKEANEVYGLGYNVIAADLPEGRKINTALWLQYTDFLARAARDYGDEVVFVAHSLGAQLSVRMAEDGLVDKLVLLEPGLGLSFVNSALIDFGDTAIGQATVDSLRLKASTGVPASEMGVGAEQTRQLIRKPYRPISSKIPVVMFLTDKDRTVDNSKALEWVKNFAPQTKVIHFHGDKFYNNHRAKPAGLMAEIMSDANSLNETFPIGSKQSNGAFVYDHGYKTKKALVFIHGLAMGSSYFGDEAKDAYKAGYNVIVVDLPMGRAMNTGLWYQYADYVGRMAHTYGEEVIFVGHSLGAQLSVRMAEDGLADKLILLQPALGFSKLNNFAIDLGSTGFGGATLDSLRIKTMSGIAVSEFLVGAEQLKSLTHLKYRPISAKIPVTIFLSKTDISVDNDQTRQWVKDFAPQAKIILLDSGNIFNSHMAKPKDMSTEY